ncbi:MAG: hypothetical protein BroJett030_23920 [Alphaproteobacteria bacterium]|nr:MAG: hypothetical protein BroJett030_23920 [Alphaproteobacteria bacterium]
MWTTLARKLAAAATLGVLIVTAAPLAAQAQIVRCAPRADLVDLLARSYQERQSGVGLVNAKTVFELFVAPSGSWTAIVSDTRGVSCVVGTGAEWHEIEAEAAPAAPGEVF